MQRKIARTIFYWLNCITPVITATFRYAGDNLRNYYCYRKQAQLRRNSATLYIIFPTRRGIKITFRLPAYVSRGPSSFLRVRLRSSWSTANANEPINFSCYFHFRTFHFRLGKILRKLASLYQGRIHKHSWGRELGWGREFEAPRRRSRGGRGESTSPQPTVESDRKHILVLFKRHKVPVVEIVFVNWRSVTVRRRLLMEQEAYYPSPPIDNIWAMMVVWR